VEEGFWASGCLKEVSFRMAFGVSGMDKVMIRMEGSREKGPENIIQSSPLFQNLFPRLKVRCFNTQSDEADIGFAGPTDL